MKFPYYEKCLRYLKIEHQWRVSLLILAALIATLRLERNIIMEKIHETQELKERQNLIAQISYMRHELAVKDFYKQANEQKEKEIEEQKRLIEENRMLLKQSEQAREEYLNSTGVSDLALEGITGGTDGRFTALINGEIYEERQQVGNYIISQITMDQVRLRHAQTNKEEVLKLFQDQELLPYTQP